jgi:hypothetical protein
VSKREKPKKRQSNQVYCFIVEGYTEENYIKLLKKLYRKSGEIKNCKGGSARNVLEEAEKIIAKEGDNFTGYIVWFDGDRYQPKEDLELKNQVLAYKNGQFEVYVYTSQPCIENWLLAHFEPANLSIQNCSDCENKLKTHIPKYEKNNCVQLERFIILENIPIAIANYPKIGEIPQKFFQ